MDNYLEKICGGKYITIYSVTGDYKNMSNYDEVKCKLQTVGINLDDANGDTLWVVQENDILFSGTVLVGFEWHIELGENNNLMVSSSVKSENKIEINLSNVKVYNPAENELNIFVYDNCTETIIETASFPIINKTLTYEK